MRELTGDLSGQSRRGTAGRYGVCGAADSVEAAGASACGHALAVAPDRGLPGGVSRLPFWGDCGLISGLTMTACMTQETKMDAALLE